MTHFPVEIEVVMEPRRHQDIRRIVLNLTTILWAQNRLYVPSTLTLIWHPTSPRRSTLLISFDYLPELIKELAISYLTAKSLPGSETTDGENTAA